MYRPLGLGSSHTSNQSLFAGTGNPFRFWANQVNSSAKHENRDDFQDQIGSNSPTPSGVETPRPDFHDKRLPGINHSYFGQVGRDPSQDVPSRSSPAATTSEGPSDQAAHLAGQDKAWGEERRTSSASIGSMVMVERAQEPVPTPPPDEPAHSEATKPAAETESSRLPPTPISSAASVVHRDGEAAENGGSMIEGGIASITQALRNFVLPKTAFGMKERRHQSLPVSSVTKSNVSAAHISNPTSSTHSSRPQTPRSSSPSHAKPPPSEILPESSKLTSDAAVVPRDKSTPPQTPRALSQEDRRVEKRSPLSSTSTAAGDAGVGTEKQEDQDNIPQKDIPSSTPRGKLSIKIAEGRNLKPSFDPYVVCQFEWNEYVSRGPRHDKMDVDDDERKGPVAALQSIPIKRTDSDMGKPMAIPMRSRQSSTNGNGDDRQMEKVTDPQWDHEATFDVVSKESELDVTVYDRQTEEFLGHVRLCLNLTEQHPTLEGFFRLEPRSPEDHDITGEIHIRMQFSKVEKKHFGPNDFQILKLIGKGTFGQVYQVRKKDTQRIYAMKVLSKKVIIQKKEIQHTIGERNILVRTATTESPFIVGLKFSFQTPTDLYLVTDFMSGGELFWHLQKEGRFKEDRAKFYIAELILALKHLHDHNIVYRDLKPENILLDANGHIALCDFGLSKANLTQDDTTNTFCGTTEYLAPEVLLDEQGYTKMVDFWSLGVLVFEMCCGWSPFYAEDTQQMYKNIAFGKVRFPRDALSTEGRNFVKGLLNRNPKHRLGAHGDAEELMRHPFFADVDWEALGKKNIPPPFKPKLSSVADTSNFDPEFTNALNTSSSLNARAAALAAGAAPASTPLSPTMQNAFQGFTFVDESTMEEKFGGTQEPEDEKMDEKEEEKDDNSLSRSRTQEHRMSGVQRTGEDGFFFEE
ncbi:Serine/threonine-protein kinase SCH9 [Exophiala dermatitidis]|uniref:non-specific serine/threonine protein kinase n=1 Tax=Exophiala dermatitidis (strain ATCC 34100 / CBS 525.76 / NIH/UT8656) TaxID=858893 RepID=H6BTA4_EXODN|nr:protein-serine/threonine kinase [Exophiala dermatitidis NIH/UT8656]EHY53500.1 protein-serine/threonine kinase [Exophiala dermatitidis NIH/UT8656]